MRIWKKEQSSFCWTNFLALVLKECWVCNCHLFNLLWFRPHSGVWSYFLLWVWNLFRKCVLRFWFGVLKPLSATRAAGLMRRAEVLWHICKIHIKATQSNIQHITANYLIMTWKLHNRLVFFIQMPKWFCFGTKTHKITVINLFFKKDPKTCLHVCIFGEALSLHIE